MSDEEKQFLNMQPSGSWLNKLKILSYPQTLAKYWPSFNCENECDLAWNSTEPTQLGCLGPILISVTSQPRQVCSLLQDIFTQNCPWKHVSSYIIF